VLRAAKLPPAARAERAAGVASPHSPRHAHWAGRAARASPRGWRCAAFLHHHPDPNVSAPPHFNAVTVA